MGDVREGLDLDPVGDVREGLGLLAIGSCFVIALGVLVFYLFWVRWFEEVFDTASLTVLGGSRSRIQAVAVLSGSTNVGIPSTGHRGRSPRSRPGCVSRPSGFCRASEVGFVESVLSSPPRMEVGFLWMIRNE